MNIHTKVNKITANQIQKYITSIKNCDQIGIITGM